MAVRTRRDAWAVSRVNPWDDVFLWYARAFAEMMSRGIDTADSWRYQAAIHEYRRALDPHASPSDRLPSPADQRQFWDQCQHNSWYFLPWHRWYLLYFEEIVAATVVSLGGPSGWSLPFWNYSDATNPDARKIPPAFVEKTTPDGSANPLRVTQRAFGNNGAAVGSPTSVALKCLDLDQFEADATHIGFGGPRTGFNHAGGQLLDVDSVEVTPHGTMHGAVGNWMGQFFWAGLDPLFWCHHANIDRLWVEWRGRKATNVDPASSAWLDRGFDFHDGGGKVVMKMVRDAVDTRTLGYVYEGTAGPAAAVVPPAGATIQKESAMEDQRTPEMVGATEAPTPLGRAPSTAQVVVTPPTGPMVLESAPGTAPERVFIHLENITGEGAPRQYSVYVNDLFAGVIPLFGVLEATSPTEKHPGDGLHYRLDVTEVVKSLYERGEWDAAAVRVTFVPDEDVLETTTEAAAAAESAPEFRVGRVSVFVA